MTRRAKKSAEVIYLGRKDTAAPPGFGLPVAETSPSLGDFLVYREARDLTNDEETTAQTLRAMIAITRDAASRPYIQALAARLQEAAQQQNADPYSVLFWYMKKNIRYQEDDTLLEQLNGSAQADELIAHPEMLLQEPDPADDCDGFSCCVASVLLAWGTPAEFRTIAGDPASPTVYTHVYVIAGTPTGSLVLDASKAPGPGLEAHAAGKIRDWPIEPVQSIEEGGQMATSLRDGPDSGGSDWSYFLQDSITSGLNNIAAPILKAQFGQDAPGTYKSIGPNGQMVSYVQPAGAAPLPINLSQLGVSSTANLSAYVPYLVVGLGLLLVVKAISK